MAARELLLVLLLRNLYRQWFRFVLIHVSFLATDLVVLRKRSSFRLDGVFPCCSFWEFKHLDCWIWFLGNKRGFERDVRSIFLNLLSSRLNFHWWSYILIVTINFFCLVSSDLWLVKQGALVSFSLILAWFWFLRCRRSRFLLIGFRFLSLEILHYWLCLNCVLNFQMILFSVHFYNFSDSVTLRLIRIFWLPAL